MSALIPFVPRQVMLGSKASTAIESKIKEKEIEKKSKMKMKKSKSNKQSETLENGSIDPITVAKGKNRQMLLSSIAAFLESNGFYKTLAVFRSETQLEVRNKKAEDFLAVIREWKMLCQRYGMENESSPSMDDSDDEGEFEEQSKVPKGEFEFGKIVGICHRKTENLDEVGLKFKVRWKGYGPSEDTWETSDGLRKINQRYIY